MKNILITIIKNFLKFFFVFPIKKNRILFSSYSGKNYSCNPKYICEYLLNQYGDYLEIVWAFKNPKQDKNLDKRIKVIRFKSVKYIYYLLTSKVVVDNVESWSILPKRKNQYIINTWHGGGAYKGVGLKRLDSSEATNRNMLNKNRRIDLYISSSKKFTELTLRQSFSYQGPVLECGMPRNDILLNYTEKKISSIRQKIGIESTEKIILYAPTYRKNSNYVFDLQFDSVISAVKKRFGGEWKILFRAHYYLCSNEEMGNKIIDVTEYEDMQELLLISHILITDYSSSIWDFSLTYKPAFLFVPDLKNYQKEREFYFPIDRWPYTYGTTLDELLYNIINYNAEESIIRIKKHHHILGIKECGKASQIVGDKIAAICM